MLDFEDCLQIELQIIIYFSFSRSALALARLACELASLSHTPMFSKKNEKKNKTTSVYRVASEEGVKRCRKGDGSMILPYRHIFSV